MSLKSQTIFLAIFLSLISLVTLPSNGSGDNWVLVGKNQSYTLYYNAASVIIDDKNHVITVLGKRVFTKQGKIEFFDDFQKDYVQKQEYINLNNSVGTYLLNYKEWKYSFNDIISYSKSGKILYKDSSILQWKDIKSDSLHDIFINKLIKNFNIKK